MWILAAGAAFAQAATIRITDARTGAPIEFVHIIFKDNTTGKQQLAVTDIKGQAENKALGTTTIAISFVGYATTHQVIEANQNYDFKLSEGKSQLNEVVVTGQYAPVSEANSVYKVKLITAEQIASRGAITLNQLLNDQLNIRIQQDNILGSGLQIQGLGDNNLKILIDGVPVAGRLNGNIDLSQINLDNIERVEIIEGPMSVVYGSNALGGTINLISKKPKKNQNSAGAKVYYETVGVYNADAYAGWSNAKTSARGNLGRNYFDGWNPAGVEGRDQQWNQKEQYFGNLALAYQFKKFNLGYSGDLLWEQIKDKGNRRSEFSNYAFDSWYTTNRYMNTLTSEISALKNYNINLMASYTYYNRSKIKYNRDLVNLTQEVTQNPTDHDTTLINTALFRGVISSTFDKKLNYQIGLDLNWENTRGGRIEGTPEIGDYAIFTSLNYKITKDFVVQPALRAAYNTQFAAPLVPSLNLQYKHKEWQYRLGYAHGFRAPSLKEMYLEFVDANHNILGNPNLTPENSKHANASAVYTKNYSGAKIFKIEPSLFYNHLTNMISLTQISASEFTYLNIDQYTTFGGKIEASYTVHPHFDFKLGYARLGYTNKNYEVLGGNQFLYSPEYSASFDYWRASKKFRFNATYKYNGAVPGFVVGANNEPVQTLIPSYNLLDITTSYTMFKNQVTVSAGAKNILDVQNLNVLNSNGGVHSSGSFPVSWGRSYFVSLKINFEAINAKRKQS